MKAIQIHSYGDTDVLELSDTVPVPVPSPDQVLIKIIAASINPFDVTIRSGMIKEKIPLSFPFTPGGDFSGIIEETGEEVYGTAQVVNGSSGAYAEYAVVSRNKISKKPKNINFEEAASIVLVGVSAVQALDETMQVKKDQKILIHGGAGGIGSIAIQLAKYLGARVTTTARTKDIEFVKYLGADEMIDFTTTDFETILQNYDGVFDTIGGEVTKKSFTVLRSGGILVSMKGQPDQNLAKKYGITAIGQSTGITAERLERLTQYIEKRAVKPQIDSVYTLDRIKEAFTKFETGRPRGKVVIKI